jgi:hypothetical protein
MQNSLVEVQLGCALQMLKKWFIFEVVRGRLLSVAD